MDQSIGFGVTRNTYSAHSKLSENTQAEKMVDRSWKPDERDSSIAQIRTLLEEQRQTIIAEYREEVGHHVLQAAHAEEERRILTCNSFVDHKWSTSFCNQAAEHNTRRQSQEVDREVREIRAEDAKAKPYLVLTTSVT